jgi:hypothetical protein
VGSSAKRGRTRRSTGRPDHCYFLRIILTPAAGELGRSAAEGVGVASVAEDWRSNHTWRDDYVVWTARGVSKHGGLGQDDIMLELGRVLTRDEALWLYGQVRDQSRRCEGDWRAEFLWLFPQVEPADLPPLPPGEPLEPYPRPPLPLPGEPKPEVEIPF